MASLARLFLWKPSCHGNTACLVELEMSSFFPPPFLIFGSFLHSGFLVLSSQTSTHFDSLAAVSRKVSHPQRRRWIRPVVLPSRPSKKWKMGIASVFLFFFCRVEELILEKKGTYQIRKKSAMALLKIMMMTSEKKGKRKEGWDAK